LNHKGYAGIQASNKNREEALQGSGASGLKHFVAYQQ
jgi:hypothetical protein